MSSTQTQPLKILLVEDHPIALKAHQIILKNLGYTLLDTATSGKEAVSKSKNEYDVIFMDVGLPDITGLDAIAAIRQMEDPQKRAYIIVLTAFITTEMEEDCLPAKIDLIKTKPVYADEMKEILSQIPKRR